LAKVHHGAGVGYRNRGALVCTAALTLSHPSKAEAKQGAEDRSQRKADGAGHEFRRLFKPEIDAAVKKAPRRDFFKFGGSSTITIFEPNRIALAPDLVEKSKQGMELYSRIGDVMGSRA
jgi:hypothetical protein